MDKRNSKLGNVTFSETENKSSKADNESKAVEPDERFALVIKGKDKGQTESENKRAHDQSLKEEIKQEQQRIKRIRLKTKMKKFFFGPGLTDVINRCFSVFDVCLNIFSIGIMAASIIITLSYLNSGNWVMSLVGGAVTMVLIYLNKNL